jgi:hypothetical protein
MASVLDFHFISSHEKEDVLFMVMAEPHSSMTLKDAVLHGTKTADGTWSLACRSSS